MSRNKQFSSKIKHLLNFMIQELECNLPGRHLQCTIVFNYSLKKLIHSHKSQAFGNIHFKLHSKIF